MHPIVKEDLGYITSAKIPWDDLEGKNILITGANGFLPAYMIETILFLNDHKFKNKAKVFVLARNKERALSRFSCYGRRTDLIYIIQDVCSPLKISKKINFIIKAASQASPKFYGVDPVGTILANTVGTANLLTLAVKHKTIVMDPLMAKNILGILKDNLEKYEKNFGEIKIQKRKTKSKPIEYSEESARYIG